MQPGVLFLSNAGSSYRGPPQDDTSFITKFLGFASPPHDGFADKYSIVTKENPQAVYAAPLLCTFIIHTAKLLVKCFSKNFFCIKSYRENFIITFLPLNKAYSYLKTDFARFLYLTDTFSHPFACICTRRLYLQTRNSLPSFFPGNTRR